MSNNQLDRYARQRLIDWWDQPRLQAATVLVAGAGALGNELLKNLALIGVGRLIIVDFDHIERSNLSRTVLFNTDDIGQPKAFAAARAVARLNPNVDAIAVNGDLFYDIGLAYYRHADLVIGCVDSLAARSQIGLNCALAGVPYLDGGMWALGGEVRWFLAGDGPCFDCTMNASDRLVAHERRSCTGFHSPSWEEPEPLPTTASTASIIGGLLTQEASKRLCQQPIMAGKAIVYNGARLSMHRTQLPYNPVCDSPHQPYDGVIELPNATAAAFTPAQLLHIAGPEATEVQLGHDFLTNFSCSNCGRVEAINQPWGKVPASRRCCPHCDALRAFEIVNRVESGSPYQHRLLQQLGVPAGAVLAVRIAKQLTLYELTGDRPFNKPST